MFIDANTSRTDLEIAIISEQDLYEQFDEQKLLNSEYTDDELRNTIIDWIEGGDETL